MRHLFISISLLFLSGILIAQQSTYTRIFSGPSYDDGVAAYRLPNKEIRLVGNTGSYGHGGTDIWLIALDSNGNFLWQKFYGTPENEKATDAIMTPQGDLFIIGYTDKYYAESYQLYFLGLDILGQVITSKTYGGKNWDFGYGICQTSDSTFALVGETYSQGNGQSDVYLLHLNRTGDVLWTKTYGGANEDRGNAIKLAGNQDLIVAGATKSYGNGTSDFYLLRLDSNGDSIWTKVYHDITDAEFLDVLPTPDTALVVCGYHLDSLDTYRDMDLMKFSDAGNLIWDHRYQFLEGSDCYANSLVNRSNGSILFGGTSTYRPTADARVIQSDSGGWWQSSVFLGTNNFDDFGYKITADDFHGEHYFMIGTTKGYGVSRSGVFLIRLDSNLYADTNRLVDFPTAISENTNTQSIQIYPNPSQDILNIQLPNQIIDGELRIYDLVGRQVFFEKLGSSIYIEVNTQSLNNGLYQIVIQSSKRLYKSKFVKSSSN